jgi:hypothetical protein
MKRCGEWKVIMKARIERKGYAESPNNLLLAAYHFLGDSQSRFSAFRNSAIAEHTFDLRMQQNCVPDKNDCHVCLCEHQVGESQIQETGSDLFLGLLVFMENCSSDFPRNWCLCSTHFWGKSILTKKNQKSALGTILRALWYAPLVVNGLGFGNEMILVSEEPPRYKFLSGMLRASSPHPINPYRALARVDTSRFLFFLFSAYSLKNSRILALLVL